MGKRDAVATYTLRFPTPSGPVTTQVEVPRGPLRLRDLVPISQRITEQNVARGISAERKEGRTVSCRRGCAACCMQIVPISAPEAFRLADHVLALDTRRRDRMLARLDEVETEIQAAGLLDEIEQIVADTHPDRSGFAARYFERRIACPFLHEDVCSVYADRPLVCRQHVVTSPASWCSEPTLHQIRTVPTPRSWSMALSAATATLTGEGAEMIPLSTAMGWVETHADLALLEWSGVEVMHALLRALGISEADIAAGVR